MSAFQNFRAFGVGRTLSGLSTRRRLLAPAVLLLVLLPGASAAGVVSTSRATAADHAVRALGANRYRGAELVFGLLEPLPAGTVISVGSPERPSRTGRVTRSHSQIIAVLHAAAWLFYQDLAPFQQYAHPGRVAVVDVATGRVSLSNLWPGRRWSMARSRPS